jgi:hypothetical protein
MIVLVVVAVLLMHAAAAHREFAFSRTLIRPMDLVVLTGVLEFGFGLAGIGDIGLALQRTKLLLVGFLALHDFTLDAGV